MESQIPPLVAPLNAGRPDYFRLPGGRRTPGVLGVSPVDAFQQKSELARGERNRIASFTHHRPGEHPAIKTLGEQAEAGAIPEQNLDDVRFPAAEAEQVTAAHRSNHSTDIPGAAGAPDMTLKSGNPCAVVGFAVMFPVGARRPAGHSTGGGTPVSRRLQTRPVPLGVRRAARFCQSHLLRPKTSRRKEAHRRPSASPEVAAMFSTPCSRTMNPIDYSP